MPGSPCLQALAEEFSDAILAPDGTLDRAQLAKRAFASPEATQKLNALTHPAILRLMEQRLEDAADAGYPAAVVDAPLLFEAGIDRACDAVIAVLAPTETRVKRLLARDGIPEQAIRQRIAAQPDDGFYRRLGVTVLENTGTAEQLREQVIAFLHEDKKRWPV